MRAQEAESMRKRYRYRRMIVTGKLKVSHRTAARLIGPDCAYHLYATFDAPSEPQDRPHQRPPACGGSAG